jgi:hypothetical protein
MSAMVIGVESDALVALGMMMLWAAKYRLMAPASTGEA